ncbi:hypothetical protein J437_LFUL005571 [Ladona fulva]|uniref:Uncharacterized protein n=1 Tax=Ladona fulva TaxID=123851 RepID=A0A8K0JWZ2_LADFU|nr:hypothetical protein J437_LFUL005571 [Ladona fulva]
MSLWGGSTKKKEASNGSCESPLSAYGTKGEETAVDTYKREIPLETNTKMATVPKDPEVEVKEDGTEISQSSFKKEESETKIQQSNQSFSSTSVKSSSVKMSSSSTSSTSGNLAIGMSPTDDLLKNQDDFMQKALAESQDRFLQQQQQMMQQIQSEEVSQVKKVVGISSSKMVVQESVEEEQVTSSHGVMKFSSS